MEIIIYIFSFIKISTFKIVEIVTVKKNKAYSEQKRVSFINIDYKETIDFFRYIFINQDYLRVNEN